MLHNRARVLKLKVPQTPCHSSLSPVMLQNRARVLKLDVPQTLESDKHLDSSSEDTDSIEIIIIICINAILLCQ